MKAFFGVIAAALAMLVSGCGASAYTSPSAPQPTPPHVTSMWALCIQNHENPLDCKGIIGDITVEETPYDTCIAERNDAGFCDGLIGDGKGGTRTAAADGSWHWDGVGNCVVRYGTDHDIGPIGGSMEDAIYQGSIACYGKRWADANRPENYRGSHSND